MRTSSAKAKGRKLQQWVAKKVSELTGIPWGSEDDKLIQSRPMGQSGSDVILRGKARDEFKYSVECKNSEKWGIPKTIEQCKKNTEKYQNWLLVLKKNRVEPIVVVDAEHFFELLGELNTLKAMFKSRK